MNKSITSSNYSRFARATITHYRNFKDRNQQQEINENQLNTPKSSFGYSEEKVKPVTVPWKIGNNHVLIKKNRESQTISRKFTWILTMHI